MTERESSLQPESEKNRSTYEVEQDLRDEYVKVSRNHNLGQEVVIEAIRDLDSSSSWNEFAQKQRINTLRIEPGTSSEKIMSLVKEYYTLKAKEESQ